MCSLKLIFQNIKETARDSSYRMAIYLLYLISRLFFRVKVFGQEKPLFWRKKNNSPFLVAARHRSYWDAAFIPVALGNSPCTRLVYLARKNLKLAFQFIPFMNSYMVYIDRKNVGKNTIKKMIRLVEEGNNLAVFPESTTIPENKKFQGGILFIIEKIEQATGKKIPIFPLNIKAKGPYGKPRGRWYHYLSNQVRIELRIGDPIFLQDLEEVVKGIKISKSQRRKIMVRELLQKVDQI